MTKTAIAAIIMAIIIALLIITNPSDKEMREELGRKIIANDYLASIVSNTATTHIENHVIYKEIFDVTGRSCGIGFLGTVIIYNY